MISTRRIPMQTGFTLIEMIISLTVLGLLSVVMLPLMTLPITSYMDAQRRVDLQTQMDLVRSKLTDDLQYALPGSLRRRKVGAVTYLEYLEVRSTGRYRNGTGGTGPAPVGCNAGDALAVGCATESYATTLGPLNPLIPGGLTAVDNADYVAIMARNANPYAPVANSPLSRLTGHPAVPNGVGLNFTAHAFPLASGPYLSPRVYIVSQPVTYKCDPNAGGNLLTRYWGYNMFFLPAPQPTAFVPVTPNASLADTVSACDIQVSTLNLRQIVSIKLTLSKSTGGQPAESVEGFIQIGVREP